MSHFGKFVQSADKKDQSEVLLRLLRTKVEEKKACMAFAIAHTEELVKVLNFAQGTSQPVGLFLRIFVSPKNCE